MNRCPDCYGTGKCDCGECLGGKCFVCGGTGKDFTDDVQSGVLPCDEAGKCQAPKGARGITNCVHCGKELRERDKAWYTWDAPFNGGVPQDYVEV